MGQPLGDGLGKADQYGCARLLQSHDVPLSILLLVGQHQVGLQGQDAIDVGILRPAQRLHLSQLDGLDAILGPAHQTIRHA